jgi:hypothetical protein
MFCGPTDIFCYVRPPGKGVWGRSSNKTKVRLEDKRAAFELYVHSLMTNAHQVISDVWK